MFNSSQGPSFIYVRKASCKAVRLPKHIVIACTAEPPTVIHAIFTKHRRASRSRAEEEQYQRLLIGESGAAIEIGNAKAVYEKNFTSTKN